MDSSYVQENTAQRERLRTLAARLTDDDLARELPGGWTVEDTASGASEGPWPTRVEAHAVAVERFRAHLDAHPELVAAARRELAGRDLACWCDDDVPCHADVWLDVANRRPGPHG